MREILSATGTELDEVPPSLRETQLLVRATPDAIGVVIVLPVVLPEAHAANLEPASLLKRKKSAARARVRLISLWQDDTHELHLHTIAAILVTWT